MNVKVVLLIFLVVVLVEQKVEGWGGRPNAPKQPNDDGAWFAVMSDVNESFQNGEAQALFKGTHPPSAAQFMGKCNTCMRKLQGIFSQCGNSESCVMQKNPPNARNACAGSTKLHRRK